MKLPNQSASIFRSWVSIPKAMAIRSQVFPQQSVLGIPVARACSKECKDCEACNWYCCERTTTIFLGVPNN